MKKTVTSQHGVLIVTVAVALIVGIARAIPAFALTNAPSAYAHSWYINASDATSMYNRGYNDGLHDNANCSNAFSIIDFGQVANESAAGYQGYGTYDFASGYPFTSDSTILTAAEKYASGWYNATGSCPRLHVELGTNNYNECPFGNQRGACSPSGAGAQWGQLVNDAQTYLVAFRMSWQITAWAANDMETGYDCASKTQGFVDGFNGNNPSSAELHDFGDAWIHSCWTDADVAYMAWHGYDWPMPEIYSQAAADRWTGVRQAYFMNFQGVTTECTGGDPLPTGNCLVNSHYENSPNQAWNQLVNDLNGHGVGGSSMTYANNIQFQH
jgi:hypothetical protein